eukprot:29915-Pelagococcus_subviridis.AAC.6
MAGWSSKASGGVQRRRGRGLNARDGRRDAPGKNAPNSAFSNGAGPSRFAWSAGEFFLALSSSATRRLIGHRIMSSRVAYSSIGRWCSSWIDSVARLGSRGSSDDAAVAAAATLNAGGTNPAKKSPNPPPPPPLVLARCCRR